MERIHAIRSRLPRVALSTDVIVGFPSETEEDFRATRDAMNEAGFDMAYIFRYSTRSGTRAAKELTDDVAQKVKEERNQALLLDLDRRAEQQNREYLGQTIEVLVEGPSKRNSERWTGRSRTNKVCLFRMTPGVAVGLTVDLLVERTTSHALYGVVRL